MAIVAVGANATATINRLSSSRIDEVQTSGVHQFLVAVANTANVTQHFDPQQDIEVTYDPAGLLHEMASCGLDLNQSDQASCQEGIVGRREGGQLSVPLISSSEAKLATRGRIDGAVSIQKLAYANAVLEYVVLAPEEVDSDEDQSLRQSGNRTVVPELEEADVAPGESVTGTMALDVGDSTEGGNIAVKVSFGKETHEFVYCIAGVG